MEYDSTCNRAFESACVKAWRPNLPPALPQPPSITIPHNHKHKHNPPQRTPTNPSTHFYSNHPHPAGMLRGPFHTPANHTAQTCLSALLTHSLAARLAEGEPQPLAPHSNPCHPPPPPPPPPPPSPARPLPHASQPDGPELSVVTSDPLTGCSYAPCPTLKPLPPPSAPLPPPPTHTQHTGMLRGPFHTPANQAAQACLSALLTHSLAARLAEGDPRPLLVCLNSSMETAQVIWNSSMREELTKVGGACNSSFQGLVLGGTEQGLRK
jgi:hypothetical protein